MYANTTLTPTSRHDPTSAELIHPELLCGDLKGAASFYNAVLGWRYSSAPVGPGYAATLGAHRCAELSHTVTKPYEAPLGWIPNLAVEDIEKACSLISTHGGQVMRLPLPEEQADTAVLAVDPAGAVFGVRLSHPTDTRPGATGELCMTELVTSYAQNSIGFYVRVFGFQTATIVPRESLFAAMSTRDCRTGVLVSAHKSPPPRERARWLIYFGTNSLDMSIATALALGARQISSTAEISLSRRERQIIRIALLHDPFGMAFGLVEHSTKCL